MYIDLTGAVLHTGLQPIFFPGLYHNVAKGQIKGQKSACYRHKPSFGSVLQRCRQIHFDEKELQCIVKKWLYTV